MLGVHGVYRKRHGLLDADDKARCVACFATIRWKVLQETPGRLVACGADRRNIDMLSAGFPSDLAEQVDHARLDPPAQHAAAHQELFGHQCRALGAGRQQSHRAVIAEPVAHIDQPQRTARIVQCDVDIGFVPRPRPGVELVGTPGELRNARGILGHRGARRDLEVQTGKERAIASGRAPLGCPRGFFAIHRRAPRVLSRSPRSVERPEMRREPRQHVGLRRHGNGGHLRQCGTHCGDLGRVVVQQNETVQAEAKLRGEGRDVLRLRAPVDAVGDHMCPPQRHIRALVEYRQHIGFAVLGTQAQHNAVIRGLHQAALQGAVPRGDAHAVRPIFGHNTLPERIVAVDHNRLDWAAQHFMQAAHGNRRQRGPAGVAPWQVGQRVGRFVMPAERTGAGRGIHRGQNLDTPRIRQGCGYRDLETRQRLSQRRIFRNPRRRRAEHQDCRCTCSGSRGGDCLRVLHHQGRQRRFQTCRVRQQGRTICAGAHQVFHTQEDKGRTIPVGARAAAGIKHVLQHLRIGRGLNAHRHSQPVGPAVDVLAQRIIGKAGHQADTPARPGLYRRWARHVGQHRRNRRFRGRQHRRQKGEVSVQQRLGSAVVESLRVVFEGDVAGSVAAPASEPPAELDIRKSTGERHDVRDPDSARQLHRREDGVAEQDFRQECIRCAAHGPDAAERSEIGMPQPQPAQQPPVCCRKDGGEVILQIDAALQGERCRREADEVAGIRAGPIERNRDGEAIARGQTGKKAA